MGGWTLEATIGWGAAENLRGGVKKSSSKTGESLSSLTVSDSVGVRWLSRPPPNASLKVHHVTKTARYSACFARTSDGKAVNLLLAVGTLLKFDYSFQWMASVRDRMHSDEGSVRWRCCCCWWADLDVSPSHHLRRRTDGCCWIWGRKWSTLHWIAEEERRTGRNEKGRGRGGIDLLCWLSTSTTPLWRLLIKEDPAAVPVGLVRRQFAVGYSAEAFQYSNPILRLTRHTTTVHHLGSLPSLSLKKNVLFFFFSRGVCGPAGEELETDFNYIHGALNLSPHCNQLVCKTKWAFWCDARGTRD